MKQTVAIALIFVISLSRTFANTGEGSDLIAVVPVTDKILMLHLKDGHIDTYGTWETVEDNVLYHDPTDLEKAVQKKNYLLTSPDDSNYSSGHNPVNIGRKSKGLEYQGGYIDPPYIWQHWIYIELPKAMQQGKTYTLNLHEITGNRNTVTFLYDVNKIRSETVNVNMVGFPEKGPKIAYLSHWMGDFNTPVHSGGGLNLDDKTGVEFRIIDYGSDETVFTGTIAKRMDKTTRETENTDFPSGNYTNADVWECDFTEVEIPGEYIVAVDGIGCSFPFEIGNNITHEPYYYALKGLFWQRQGIMKEVEPDSVHPRSHHPDDIVWRYDKNWIVDAGYDESGFNKESPEVKGIWGHYYDAGDWDHYTHHNRVPAHLLLLYDLAPDRFYDGDADNRYKPDPEGDWIDEGNNGKPDLLDEAAWLIEFCRRARQQIQKQGGTGGVPGYVGRDAIPHSNRLPAWEDTRDWFVSGENPLATMWYAGNSAYYAVNLNQFHQLNHPKEEHNEFAKWLLEATEAWEWANSRALSTDEFRRVRGYAAASIYRATGDVSFQQLFEEYWNWEPNKSHSEIAGVNIWDVSAAVFTLIPPNFNGLNKKLQDECRNHILARADERAAEVVANGFRNGMTKSQFMQLGAFSTARTTTLAVAHRITGKSIYLDVMQHIANYVLGGNQLNMTYLSGLGERSDQWIFQPSAYLVSNRKSMVYTPENYIGQTSYFGATGLSSQYWQGKGTWKWSEYFSRLAAHPQLADPPSVWPGSEQKMHNRYSIQGGEFTIHQQMNHMIFSMGYLHAMANNLNSNFTLEPRPVVRLAFNERKEFPRSGCYLKVSASENTRSVKYYVNWRFIGESTDKENDFVIFFKPSSEFRKEVTLTAVALNNKGRLSVPSTGGERIVLISDLVICDEKD